MPCTRLMIWIFSWLVVGVAWGELTDKPVRLGYSEIPAPPYQIFHEQEAPGISFEILNEVASRLGLNFEYIRLPNRRVLYELGNGQLDGALTYSWKPDRLPLAVYPMKAGQPDHARRMATLSYYLYSLNAYPVDWAGVPVRGLPQPIGANQGYSVADDLREAGYEVLEARNTTHLFRLLREGRIALAAHQAEVVEGWKKRTGDDLRDVRQLSPPLSTKDYFLIFSHDFMRHNRSLAQSIWQMIGEVRDPVTDSVRSRYGQ